MHIDDGVLTPAVSPDSAPTTSLFSPEEILSILRQARQLPGCTVARLEFLHRALEDNLPIDAYSIPEIMQITDHCRRQAFQDKEWAHTCGLFPSVHQTAPCSVSPFKEDFLEGKEQTEHGALERTALHKLKEIGWGRLGEHLISRWDDHAAAYIQRHGPERVLYAIEYAEKEGQRRDEEFGPGWITCCLRNPEFMPPDGWSPVPMTDNPEEIPEDPVYRRTQWDLIENQISPYERLLNYFPDEAERMRQEFAGHRWLSACPVYQLEAYRDFLWDQVGQVGGRWRMNLS